LPKALKMAKKALREAEKALRKEKKGKKKREGKVKEYKKTIRATPHRKRKRSDPKRGIIIV